MHKIQFHEEALAELQALPADIRGRFLRLFDRLRENATQLREPHSKPIGDGIFELRSKGSVAARGFYFYWVDNQIVMLRFFIKKTQKAPKQEILTAARRKKEVIDNG